MTKPVVSVAVMVLVERGQLLLSDPVSRWLPEFAHQQVATAQGLEPVKQEATVQDLLRHTAGLTYEFLGTSPVQQQYAQAKIASRERTNAEFSQALAAMPLQFQPGSVWAYSRATDVLGRLVEVVSGQGLGAFLQAEIFGPLGMVETGFSVPPEHHHRIAEPFAHDPDGGVPMKVLEPRQVPAMEGGGGGLMSTTLDFARFLQFLRNRGELNGVRLLGPHTVDYMTADHLGGIPADGTLLPPGHGFGLGFAVRTHLGLAPVPGSVGLYYWGGIAGTTFFVDPALDMYAMLMVQAPNQRDYYRPLFRDLVYAALL
jgi:CubicO group peptidase (beta-lactamase class C family)